jgi:hypothetical protein
MFVYIKQYFTLLRGFLRAHPHRLSDFSDVLRLHMKPKRSAPEAGKRNEKLYQELTAIAESLLIEVREEKLLREVGYHVRSGACRLKDRDMIFLDRQVPLADRVEALMDEIGRRELEGIYMSPDLRRMLEGIRGGMTLSLGGDSDLEQDDS